MRVVGFCCLIPLPIAFSAEGASMKVNNYPKLHNAAWPGVVGKGSPGAEPFIDLDTMLDHTAKANVNGVKFDGFDLFLYDPAHLDRCG